MTFHPELAPAGGFFLFQKGRFFPVTSMLLRTGDCEVKLGRARSWLIPANTDVMQFSETVVIQPNLLSDI